ncbi:MAG: hypothetical protein GX465_15700 [Acidobacteria bacterium]|nr:hypothetical protein [Acidobacteriota bacterium]
MIFTIHSKKYGPHKVEIDDEDWPKIKDYTWCVQTRRRKDGAVIVLAVVSTKRNGTKTKTIYLHRLLVAGKMIDHKNGNVLDNRKLNLRVCDYSSNRQNAKPNYTADQGLKGVRQLKTKMGKIKYFAQIKIDGKRISRGNFDTREDAAVAYNNLAVEYFGAFARLNEIAGAAR